jgi:hypothetical protein
MNIKNSLYSVFAVLALLVGSAIAFAHNGVEHIMGTVTAVTDISVTVDTVKHTSATVLLDPSTKFTNNVAQASRKDVKVGDRVAINAKENADKKLVALTVKLGAKSTTPADHTGHKK